MFILNKHNGDAEQTFDTVDNEEAVELVKSNLDDMDTLLKYLNKRI